MLSFLFVKKCFQVSTTVSNQFDKVLFVVKHIGLGDSTAVLAFHFTARGREYRVAQWHLGKMVTDLHRGAAERPVESHVLGRLRGSVSTFPFLQK